MHKKPFVAVLIIGLLLLTGTAFAIQEDHFVRVQSPAVEKPTSVSRTALPADPAVAIQGGTPRTVPGTYCNGEWQSGATYFSAGWFYGAEIYAAYQDPAYGMANVFGPGCTSPAYAFDVTAAEMWLFAQAAAMPVTLQAQPLVWDADIVTDPACPYPADLLCSGPVYTYNIGGGGAWIFNMAFSLECCVTGPYFASVYWVNSIGTGVMEIIMDDGGDFGGLAPQPCRVYNDWGGGFADLYDYGFNNVELYSEGFTPDDVATHCTPGTCDAQFWYYGDGLGSMNEGWWSGYGIPSGNRSAHFTMYTNNGGADTLTGMNMMLWAVADGGAPTLRVEVYSDDGLVDPDCGLPIPGTSLGYVDVPYAAQSRYPVPTTVDLTSLGPLVFGTLNGGPLVNFFIVVSLSPDSPDPLTDFTVLCYGDLDEGGLLYVTPQCSGLYTSPSRGGMYITNVARHAGSPLWAYNGAYDQDVSAVFQYETFEWWMDALMCYEQVPIVEEECGPGSTDDWPTFAHDYQNTSASSINVGDPNGIKLEWWTQLGATMDFCNPTIANDWVYASSANRVQAFDLATGAPAPGSPFTGIPEMGTSNRANTTIHGGYAYITGGNFAALSKLPVGNLAKASMLWSNNAMTYADMTYQNRFGCAMVLDDLDIVLVLTEPISNPGMQGELFAFNNSDGTLYGGWATNPVLLDKAARHGPSYDGTWLFVGTADADLTDGSIWCIDPATGTPVWQFQDNTIDAENPGGFPGGVSVDGDFLFAVSCDANAAGRRFCIDKSAGSATVVWGTAQGSRSLYGPPTIGRNFIYVPYDNNAGIGMIDKGIGLQVHNFALGGVGSVSQNVAMSCDNILFAGDRNAQWWVLNANTTDAEFYRQFPLVTGNLMNGTALGSHSSGDDYAATSCRTNGTAGLLAVYKLNTGARPRLEQHEFAMEILVPLGASGVEHATVDEALLNIGDADLTVGPATVDDPGGMVASVRRTIPTDERAIAKLQSAGFVANGEWRPSEYSKMTESLSKSTRDNVYSVAGATSLRTQNITFNGGATAVLAGGDYSDIQFDYDISGLGRGVDIETIMIPNTDPDFDLTMGSSVAEFEVTYQGGCPTIWDTLTWVDGTELMTNVGMMGGQGDTDNLVWTADPFDPHGGTMYDGGFYLLWADSADEAVRNYMFGEGDDFVGNVAPTAGLCGFDKWSGTMGYWNNAGTPVAITGMSRVVSYSDTNFAGLGLGVVPDDAIGLDIVQTEVGADDALFGEFKLIHLQYNERNGNAVDVYGGTFVDWDVQAAYGSNLGAIWPTTVKGYCVWDEITPGLAYGFLDPDQPTTYGGVDATHNPIQGAVVIDHNNRGITPGTDGEFWNMAVSEAGAMLNDGQGDRAGMMTNGMVSVPANGTASICQALFAVDATGGSANEAVMEADAMAIAARAARWAGYARGNVNDDANCDLGDVWWLNMHVNVDARQLYPDTYCGDVDGVPGVDGADVNYLFAWVTGMGPAPQGAWRF